MTRMLNLRLDGFRLSNQKLSLYVKIPNIFCCIKNNIITLLNRY